MDIVGVFQESQRRATQECDHGPVVQPCPRSFAHQTPDDEVQECFWRLGAHASPDNLAESSRDRSSVVPVSHFIGSEKIQESWVDRSRLHQDDRSGQEEAIAASTSLGGKDTQSPAFSEKLRRGSGHLFQHKRPDVAEIRSQLTPLGGVVLPFGSPELSHYTRLFFCTLGVPKGTSHLD